MVDNNSNCSGFTGNQILLLSTITSSVAAMSFVCCVCAIFVIILFKKYLFFTQRMILYLNIAALLSALARIINNIEISTSTPIQKEYCIATGFLDQYSSSCFLTAITSFTIDIFLQAIFSLNTQRAEVIYLLLIFFSPSLYCWIPLIRKAYGPAGPWCWIKGTNDDNCDRFTEGTILRFSLFYIPYFILLPFLLVLILMMLYTLYLRRHNYGATSDALVARRRTALRSEIKILLLYPTIVIIMNIIPLISRICNAAEVPDNKLFILWFMNAIAVPLEVAVVPIVFTLDPQTRRRLTFTGIRAAMNELCSRNGSTVSVYPAEIRKSTESYGQQSTDKTSSDKEPLLKDLEYNSYDSSM